MAEYDEVLVTPHVLAETSNLLGYISDPLMTQTRTTLRLLMPLWQEHFTKGIEITEIPIYLRLGITDSALFSTSSASITLLTDDLPLYLAASSAGHAAINFTHLRQARGTL